MAKALLLRYHPLSSALTDQVVIVSSPVSPVLLQTLGVRLLSVFQLFSLLTDPALGSQAADGFGVLMSDSPDVLNRDFHADVRIMYRQRFFAENSSKLVHGFNAAEQGTWTRSSLIIPVHTALSNECIQHKLCLHITQSWTKVLAPLANMTSVYINQSC